jgi:hypothetical protein
MAYVESTIRCLDGNQLLEILCRLFRNRRTVGQSTQTRTWSVHNQHASIDAALGSGCKFRIFSLRGGTQLAGFLVSGNLATARCVAFPGFDDSNRWLYGCRSACN